MNDPAIDESSVNDTVRDATVMEGTFIDAEALRRRALTTLTTARARTTLLTSCVEGPDLTAQHSPLMSPLVWDLAHIGNQEELWLLRAVAGREAMRPEIDGLYDAFEHPRSERPSLPLLPPAEARTYAADVRGRVMDLLESADFHGTRLTEAGFAFGMIAQHEQQHDETMLITHQLRKGPRPSPPRTRNRHRWPADRPKSSSPAARSPWAPPASRGRWTTNARHTGARWRPSTSTRRR